MTCNEHCVSVEHTSFTSLSQLWKSSTPSENLTKRSREKGAKIPIAEEIWVDRVRRLDALRDLVIKNIEAAHQRQATHYNKGRRDVRYQAGDLVMRKAHVLSSGAWTFSAKLAPDWEGPFEIEEIKPSNVYILNMGNRRKNPKVHVGKLKKYREGRRGKGGN